MDCPIYHGNDPLHSVPLSQTVTQTYPPSLPYSTASESESEDLPLEISENPLIFTVHGSHKSESMSRTVRSIFFLVLLLVVAPTPSHSFYTYYSRYRNTVSLAHSLMIGVANLRASRGDVAGADRARAIADKLDRGLGLGFWRLAVAAGWDYATSFAWWRDLSMMELYGAVSEMNELLRGLTELTQLGSDQARAAWVGRNYQNVLTISKSLCAKLLKAFRKSGVMREIVETVKKEVIEGGLVRDCLELGSKDLKALIQTLKDFAVRFFPDTDTDTHSERYRSDL